MMYQCHEMQTMDLDWVQFFTLTSDWRDKNCPART